METDGEANLVEIFASAQGEGPHVGRSTVFVRFGECDLRCAWCDSPGTWRPTRSCRIETAPGSGEFDSQPNPVARPVLAQALARLTPSPHSFLSLTGGEPLLQVEAVAAAARLGRERGMRVHLETHGLASEALAQVADRIDVVSMDWKLTSDVRRRDDPRHGAVTDFHASHQRFLACALRCGEVYVKVVVTPNTRDSELDELCRRIAETAPGVPLILQPVTARGRVESTPDARTLLAWLWRCEALLADVRLIPQTHRVIGAL